MLRVKISLVYLVLLSLLILAAVGLVHVKVGDLAVTAMSSTLQQAVVGAEQSAHLEEASLLARARFVASNDRLYRSLQGEFVGDTEGSDGDGPAEEAADFEGQRHLDAHEKLTAQDYHLKEMVAQEKDVRAEERSLLAREPQDLDIFMVLDGDGKGVAALGKDLYSWFGDDLGKQFPDVGEVAGGGAARSAYWMWSFKPTEEKRLHRVAIAPLRRTVDEQTVGVVVLGSIVNDGLARRKQALFAGGETLDVPVHLAFYRGNEIVGSTFSSDEQQIVAGALGGAGLMSAEPTELTEIVFNEEPHLAVSRPLAGGEAAVGLAVVASVTAAKAPMGALQVDIVLIGIILLLIGLVLIVVLIHRYIKPVENLEDGIQEVIAGNREYVWTQLTGHELQAGLAQQLNLMSAFLQGKPMPDDDSAGQGWGDLMKGGEQKPEGPGEVKGVDLAGLMGASKPKSDNEDGANE